MIGGIAGQVTNDCIVQNCYNEGIVNADNNVGGIAGNVAYNSIISSCYNKGAVSGTNVVAGIAGDLQLDSKINNCYNIGKITGGDKTGGIVGYPRSTGSEVNNCYFLEDTVDGINDFEIHIGVELKKSEELKSLVNILGESYKNDINNMNNGYPILTWQ